MEDGSGKCVGFYDASIEFQPSLFDGGYEVFQRARFLSDNFSHCVFLTTWCGNWTSLILTVLLDMSPVYRIFWRVILAPRVLQRQILRNCEQLSRVYDTTYLHISNYKWNRGHIGLLHFADLEVIPRHLSHNFWYVSVRVIFLIIIIISPRRMIVWCNIPFMKLWRHLTPTIYGVTCVPGILDRRHYRPPWATQWPPTCLTIVTRGVSGLELYVVTDKRH